jgi:lipopolysaccharide transport system permease protein
MGVVTTPELAAAQPALSEAPPSATPEILIAPSRGWGGFGLRDLWTYRELLYFLVWRDFKVRYKQTALGAAWAVLQPFLMMVVFSLFFGQLAGVPSDGVPYPLFSFAALVPWTFFAHGLTQSATSLISSANLLKKIYFPRLLIPTAAVLSGAVDFAIAFGMLLVLMAYYGVWPSLAAVWALPLLVILAFVSSLGVSLWLSAFSAEYRDVRYVVPFLVQLWLFATPIAYPSSLLKEPWHTLYALNPMVGVVEGFRWSLLGTATAPGPLMGLSVTVAVLVLIGGAMRFRRLERTFADVL